MLLGEKIDEDFGNLLDRWLVTDGWHENSWTASLERGGDVAVDLGDGGSVENVSPYIITYLQPNDGLSSLISEICSRIPIMHNFIVSE